MDEKLEKVYQSNPKSSSVAFQELRKYSIIYVMRFVFTESCATRRRPFHCPQGGVGSGVEPDKVATVQFGTDEIEKLAQESTLDADLAVDPLDSKITVSAIAATSRSRGAPKFLPVDASGAIALKQPRYEAEEIPSSVFSANPAWPEDKVDTISVNHLILTRKELSEAKAAAFYRQLFAVRDSITQRVAGAARITKLETEKEAEPSVHRGTAAVINGIERRLLLVRPASSFRDRFGRCMAASLSER